MSAGAGLRPFPYATLPVRVMRTCPAQHGNPGRDGEGLARTNKPSWDCGGAGEDPSPVTPEGLRRAQG